MKKESLNLLLLAATCLFSSCATLPAGSIQETRIKGNKEVKTVVVEEPVQKINNIPNDLESIILRWNVDSDPRGARVSYRVISSVPNEVKNTNEAYISTTPLEETRGFNIKGLTRKNANNISIEIKVEKRGYETQVKRYNLGQAIDQQEISGFFELVSK